MVFASLLVKVIGALFQIPLKNLIGSNGYPAFGLFSMAYRIYTAVLVIATIGLPAALSKMVAEASATGREQEVKRITKAAAMIFIPIGAVCTAVLYFGAEIFAEWICNPDAMKAVGAIAPSVLMVSILSVFRGYYQGRSNMVPTAVSQVIEAMGKLFIGLGLAYFAMGNNLAAPEVAAYTIFGITLGEVLAALYVIVQASIARKTKKHRIKSLNDSVRPWGTICKTLLSLSIPITISSAVMSITDLIDVALISERLQSPAVAMTANQAASTYGVYTGMAVNFFNLPQTLITALAVSLLPAIAGANASQNFAKASKLMETAFRLTMMITLPAGAGFLILSQRILQLLYRSDTALGGQLMAILGFAVPAVALVAITNAVLQAIGRADLPLISMFIGAVVKLFSDYVLLGNPNVQIAGAPISTALCYSGIALMNLFHIARLTKWLPSIERTLLKPLAATVGMGAGTVICVTVLTRIFGFETASFGDKMITLIAIVLAVILYLVLLLLIQAVDKEDIHLLPGGDKIAKKICLK